MIIKAGLKFVNLDLAQELKVINEILEFSFVNDIKVQIACRDKEQAKLAFEFIESKITNPNSEFADINQYLARS